MIDGPSGIIYQKQDETDIVFSWKLLAVLEIH